MSMMPKAGSNVLGTVLSTGQLALTVHGTVCGCNDTTSVTITPSTGVNSGISVLLLKFSSHALYSGGARVRVGLAELAAARLAAEQGTMVPVVFCSRH